MFIEVSLRFDEMDEPYNMSIKLSITLTTFLKLLKMSRVVWFIFSFYGNIAKMGCIDIQGLNDCDLSFWLYFEFSVRATSGAIVSLKSLAFWYQFFGPKGEGRFLSRLQMYSPAISCLWMISHSCLSVTFHFAIIAVE